MSNRVAISGMGIVSSIGMNVEETRDALLHSRYGLTRIENIDTQHKNAIFVGEVKKTNSELLQLLGINKTPNDYSRTSMLGLLAVKEAIQNAGIEVKDNHSLGFINSTTVGGMDIIETYYRNFLESEENRHYIEVHDAGSNTEIIASELGIKGIVTTISTACSSAANAVIFGAELIKSGRLDQVIVGGMDGLCKFTINGFNTLMILSDELNQPFDNERKGLNLGEGAAYLVLESEESLKARSKTPIAYLTGYANANDAFHQTASSDEGEGAYLAMKEAIELAGISVEQIDYINAHGTATPNNDLSEGRAISKIFEGKQIPPISSTKPFTGHTLAAAAGVEAVFSILALQEQIIYPNLNFRNQMEEFNWLPELELKKADLDIIVSNSFGFGGNCSTLIFEKAE